MDFCGVFYRYSCTPVSLQCSSGFSARGGGHLPHCLPPLATPLAAYAVARCLSVCLSVRHVRGLCRNKKNLSSKLFSHHSSFSIPNSIAIFRRGPSTGASNAGVVGTNRDYRRMMAIGSMTAAVGTTTATVHRAVYRTDGDASVNLCLSQPAWTTRTKRRERNSIYLYAAVNLKCK